MRLDQEFGSAGADSWLVRQVNNVIGPDQVNAGAFPVLFGTNEAFKKQIWRGAIERLLAAFLLVKKKLALGLYGSDMERSQMEISQETIRSRSPRSTADDKTATSSANSFLSIQACTPALFWLFISSP